VKTAVWTGIAALLALTAGIIARNGWLPFQAKPEPLPLFSLPDSDGHQHSIREWQGKILVINFWATWCPPCKKEIPDFIDLQKRYGDKGLQFIGIAIEDKAPVDEFLTFTKINYPILIGNAEGIALAHQLGNIVDGVPYTLIVNAEGDIVERHFGEFSKQQVLDSVLPLLSAVQTKPKLSAPTS
jgi:thiol-disulfide isomerase/thioredoxin